MDDQVVTDIRFSIVPHWLINSQVSDRALRLYAVLARFADSETAQAFPGRTRLSKELRCSLKSVDRAVSELEDVGAIRKVQRVKDGHYQSSLYTVIRVDPASPVTRPRVTPDATPRHERRDPVSPVTHITRTTELEPIELQPLNDIEAQFTQFWDVYPSKKDKPRAKKSFQSALKRTSFDVILAGAQRYRDDPNRQDQFTKNPCTWLNNDAWDNPPEPAPVRKLANWEQAALLARKYREQAEQPAIEYYNETNVRELESSTWLKGLDDD